MKLVCKGTRRVPAARVRKEDRALSSGALQAPETPVELYAQRVVEVSHTQQSVMRMSDGSLGLSEKKSGPEYSGPLRVWDSAPWSTWGKTGEWELHEAIPGHLVPAPVLRAVSRGKRC